MKKEYFKNEVRRLLAGYSDEDIEKALEFYEEAIDDRMEDGMGEDEAVAAVGTPEEVARQIQMDQPLSKLVKQKVKEKEGMSTGKLVAIILTSPFWLPLAIVALTFVFVFVVVIMSLLFAALIVVGSLIAAAAGAILAGLVSVAFGGGFGSVISIGAAMVLLGIGILLIIPAKAISKGSVKLIGRFMRWIKHFFVK